MILTIKAADRGSFNNGIWEASMMMGLEVETHADNTFDVICHDPDKVTRILEKSNGRVIAQK